MSSKHDERLQRRLDDERRKSHEQRKIQKEKMKSVETPEEKRARRLAKKLAKEQKRKEELGWDEECLGYTNIDNPFGDKNLTQPFIWGKKLEKEGLSKAPMNEITKISRVKLEANKQELEKIRRNREERESQREEWAMMQRDRENKKFAEWSKQEDSFHLQQARQRSKIRIQEGRPKPIDLLARCIDLDEDNDDLAIEMNEPYTYLKGLTVRDLEDLLEDIKIYRKLDGQKNSTYWNDVSTIAEDEILKLRKYDPTSSEFVGDRRQGIHGSVLKDVAAVLKGKSHSELALLETQIQKKIKSGEEGVDVGYWETLLAQLKAHMARARLRDRHQETLRFKLARLKQEQGVIAESTEGTVDISQDDAGPSTSGAAAGVSSSVSVEEPAESVPWDSMSTADKREQMYDAYEDSGRYSPTYIGEETVVPGTEIVDPVEDVRRLKFSRNQYKTSGSSTSQKDSAMEAIARKGMTNEEATFAVEAPVEQKTYLWSDKYRPRKPRYFNRVHTGFEWNKYNQTHYDLDNPPPKIVQGYKFNIFFPDLLDQSKTPEFTLIPCSDNDDFALLKFRSGPPYEDIAFKIVNREWEVSHKKGYRCQFQNGIFQLWFHFKKYRYRR